jgi:hypothetical protein
LRDKHVHPQCVRCGKLFKSPKEHKQHSDEILLGRNLPCELADLQELEKEGIDEGTLQLLRNKWRKWKELPPGKKVDPAKQWEEVWKLLFPGRGERHCSTFETFSKILINLSVHQRFSGRHSTGSRTFHQDAEDCLGRGDQGRKAG